MVMLAAATPRKKGNSAISKVALKNNNDQIENNRVAIELLQQSLMEVTQSAHEERKAFELMCAEMQKCNINETKKRDARNVETAKQLEKVRSENILLRESVQRLSVEVQQMRKEQENLRLVGDGTTAVDKNIRSDIDHLSGIMTENQQNIAKQNKEMEKNLHILEEKLKASVLQADVVRENQQSIINIEKRQNDCVDDEMLKETEDILMNNITDINRRVLKIESDMAEVSATNINGDGVSQENNDATPQVNDANDAVSENDPPRTNHQKTVVKSDVVLVMDSNRQYIDPKVFWYGHSCRKMKAGNVADANKLIDEHVFENIKHAILHVGINDVEVRERNAESIANDVIRTALKLQQSTDAITYISSVPPRDDNLNNKCLQVNHHLKTSVPESIRFIE